MARYPGWNSYTLVTSHAVLLASSCASAPAVLPAPEVRDTPLDAFCSAKPDNCLPYEAVVQAAKEAATRGNGSWNGATVATCDGLKAIRRGSGGCDETRVYDADGKLISASSRCDGEARRQRWGVAPIVHCAAPQPLVEGSPGR